MRLKTINFIEGFWINSGYLFWISNIWIWPTGCSYFAMISILLLLVIFVGEAVIAVKLVFVERCGLSDFYVFLWTCTIHKHVRVIWFNVTVLILCTDLAIGSFPQHSQQFKTVRSNSFAVSVHTFTCQLHLFCLIATKGQRKSYLFILIYVCIKAILYLLLWLCHGEVTNIILNMKGKKQKGCHVSTE